MARPKLNWSQARDEYITGEESFSQVAMRYHVSAKLVEQHALKRRENAGSTWGALRSEYRARVSHELLRDAAALSKENAQLRLMASNASLRQLLDLAHKRRLSPSELTATAKLGIDPHLSSTGVSSGPTETAIDVDGLSEKERAVLGRVIEIVLRPDSLTIAERELMAQIDSVFHC